MASANLWVVEGGRDRIVPVPSEPLMGSCDGVYRLRMQIEPALAARACEQHTPQTLGWLESQIPRFTSTAVSAERAQRWHRRFHTALLSPATSAWDLRILTPIWQEIDHRLGMVIADLGVHLAELPGSGNAYYTLIEAFRTGDPAATEEAVRAHITRNQEGFALLTRATG